MKGLCPMAAQIWSSVQFQSWYKKPLLWSWWEQQTLLKFDIRTLLPPPIAPSTPLLEVLHDAYFYPLCSLSNFSPHTALSLPDYQKPTPFLPLSYAEQFHFPQPPNFFCTAADLAKALELPLVRIYKMQSSNQDHPPPKSLSFCVSEVMVVSFFQSHVLWMEVPV